MLGKCIMDLRNVGYKASHLFESTYNVNQAAIFRWTRDSIPGRPLCRAGSKLRGFRHGG